MTKFFRTSILKNYHTWIVFAISCLLSLISVHAMMLFAISWFQSLILLWLIPEARLQYKSRRWQKVSGTILEIRKKEDEYDKGSITNIARIGFGWPHDRCKYETEYTDRFDIRDDKEFTVLVNENDPSKSVVKERFHVLWWFDMILWSLVVIGLFYYDYLRIKDML